MSCRKVQFPDKKAAVIALHTITNTKDGRKKPIRVYECELCGKWHLTSKGMDEAKQLYYKPKLDWSKILSNGK